MKTLWTIEDLKHFRNTGETPEDVERIKRIETTAKKAARQKYRNKIIKRDGIVFRSKKEYERYYNNILRVKSGELLFFLFQIPFYLEGGVKYVLDFLEVEPGWKITAIDTKGFKTREYLNKKKQIKARYGLEIVEI